MDDSSSDVSDDTLYGFNDSYFLSDTIDPDNGYWIRASTGGYITLSNI